MTALSADQIVNALTSIKYLGTDEALASLVNGDPTLHITENGDTELTLDFSVPIASQAQSIAEHLNQLFPQLTGIVVGRKIESRAAQNFSAQIKGVSNVIAVASGKGGVGKSTTSVNLALALVKEGARVGLLDADIYGPSQPHMLSIEGKRPDVRAGNRIVPIDAYGVQCVSMGNLVTDKTPMVWRGPMASGALQQLLTNTDWEEVDYLIIDMPPGTGDIPLTLSQKVPVSGAVIVTTPQDIALLDAKKGIEMFNKVNIPILGVVENMAVHICSQCGHQEHIFGEDGGRQLAEQYGVDLLAALPLDLSIRLKTDAGSPPVVDAPESEVAQLYRNLARKVAVSIAKSAAPEAPQINITED